MFGIKGRGNGRRVKTCNYPGLLENTEGVGPLLHDDGAGVAVSGR